MPKITSAFSAADETLRQGQSRLDGLVSRAMAPPAVRAKWTAAAASSMQRRLHEVFDSTQAAFDKWLAVRPADLPEDEAAAAKKLSVAITASFVAADEAIMTVGAAVAELQPPPLPSTAPSTTPDLRPRVKIDLPRFAEDSPDTWFERLEGQFVAARVQTQAEKWAHLNRFLSNRQAERISSISVAAPNPYDSAKKVLIDSYRLTKSARFDRAVKEEMASDEDVQDVFARLKRYLTGLDGGDILKICALRTLPASVQDVLQPKLDQLSPEAFRDEAVLLMAWRRQAVPSTVAAVPQAPADPRESPADVVAAIGASRSRRSQGKKKAGHKADDSAATANPRSCLFHRAFAEKAKACTGTGCPQWKEGLRHVRYHLEDVDSNAGNGNGAAQ